MRTWWRRGKWSWAIQSACPVIVMPSPLPSSAGTRMDENSLLPTEWCCFQVRGSAFLCDRTLKQWCGSFSWIHPGEGCIIFILVSVVCIAGSCVPLFVMKACSVHACKMKIKCLKDKSVCPFRWTGAANRQSAER